MSLGTIILIVCIVWAVSENVLRRIKHSRSEDAQQDKSSLRILWITIGVSITIGMLFASWGIGSFNIRTPAFAIAGLALIVLGLMIRWTAILTLKRQFTVDVAISKDHQIISNGIYRFIRHPAYLGSLVSFFGLGICFSNYLVFLIIFVPICWAFLHRIRIEEEALTNAFGEEYRRYCATTKRLIPGIY